jgi:hypothetical protein
MKNFSSVSKICSAVAVSVLAVASLSAATHSTLVVKDDLGDIVTVTEAGAVTFSGNCNTSVANVCSTNAGSAAGGAGVAMWSGTIGRFTVMPAAGKFDPASPTSFNFNDLQLTATNTSTGTGTLHVYFTTNGVEGAGPHFAPTIQTQASGSTISYSYSSDFDNTNSPVGTGSWPGSMTTITGTCAPGGNCFAGPDYPTGGPSANPFSITNETLVTVPAGAGVNNDYQLIQVPGALSLSCPAITSGTVGAPYSDSLLALGGVPPYSSYIVISGSLPTGLTLNVATGLISGTPAAAGAFTFGASVTDSAGTTATTATSSCSVTISPNSVTQPPPGSGPYTTYTQGGWGATPHGCNPGALLTKKFSTVYPGGYVAIGGNYYLKFTSASAIINFLPQGGTAGKLTSSATNPTTSKGGVLAGQVLALRLSVDFSTAGVTRTGLANLKLTSGKLMGQTVSNVLALANAVLGGATPPTGISISDIVSILDSINNNFDNGTVNNGYLM